MTKILSRRARDILTAENNRIVLADLQQCEYDPIYFINNHLRLLSLGSYTTPITLSEPQERLIRALHAKSHVITLQPRQAGQTTAVLCYLVWKSLFRRNQLNVFVSMNFNYLQSLISSVKMMLANINLPRWGIPYLTQASTTLFKFSNGSSLEFATIGAFNHSFQRSTVFLDSFSYIASTSQMRLWQNAISAITLNGQMIVGGTPAKPNDLFHTLWNDAEHGRNVLFPVRVKWQEIMLASRYITLHQMYGSDVMRREYDCEFV